MKHIPGKFTLKQLQTASQWWSNQLKPLQSSHLLSDSPLNHNPRKLSSADIKTQLNKLTNVDISLRNHLHENLNFKNHLPISDIFNKILNYALINIAKSKEIEHKQNPQLFKHDFLAINLHSALPNFYTASPILQKSLKALTLLTHQPHDLYHGIMGIYAHDENAEDCFYSGKIFVGNCSISGYDINNPIFKPDLELKQPHFVK